MTGRRTWPALALALLVGLAAACGGPARRRAAVTPTAAAPSPDASVPATITWAYWGDPQERFINERIIRLFEAEYPHIHVEGRWAAYADYVKRLLDWNASGDPPDVAFLSDIPEYAAAGLIQDLTPFINAEHYDLSDFYPQMLAGFHYNGALFGLPRDNDTKVIFYNKDLFDAAGLPYPQSGWNWADMRRDALALTRHGAQPQYGFAFETAAWWKLWVWQSGGELYDDPVHPTRTAINSPAAVTALRFLRDLIYTDRVTPAPADLTSSERIGSLFESGRLAMAFGNHALVPLFAAAGGLHWGVAPLPSGVRRVNFAGGAGYVIMARSTHQQTAWTFLKWLLSAKGEAIFTESGVIVPSRRSIGRSNLFLQQGVSIGDHGDSTPRAGAAGAGRNLVDTGHTFLDETEQGRPDEQFPGYRAILDALDSGLQPIWSSGADPQTITDLLAPQVNALLEVRH